MNSHFVQTQLKRQRFNRTLPILVGLFGDVLAPIGFRCLHILCHGCCRDDYASLPVPDAGCRTTLRQCL